MWLGLFNLIGGFKGIAIAVAVAIVLGVCGYYVYSYHHMQTQIIDLNRTIDGLKLRADVIEKAQAAADAVKKAQTKVVNRNVQEQAVIDQVVGAGDNVRMRELFVGHGLLQPAQSGTSPGRPPSHP